MARVAVDGRIREREVAVPTAWALLGVGLVADAATTYYGLRVGLVEANPVASAAFARVGVLPGIALLKGASVWWCRVCADRLPVRYRFAVPGAVAALWLAAGLANLGALLA